MTENFDSDSDLPRPTKVILAKWAFAGAALVVGVIGTLLTMALDSFEAAFANIGISVPVSLPILIVGLIVLFILFFLKLYYALTQYARRKFFGLGPR